MSKSQSKGCNPSSDNGVDWIAIAPGIDVNRRNGPDRHRGRGEGRPGPGPGDREPPGGLLRGCEQDVPGVPGPHRGDRVAVRAPWRHLWRQGLEVLGGLGVALHDAGHRWMDYMAEVVRVLPDGLPFAVVAGMWKLGIEFKK